MSDLVVTRLSNAVQRMAALPWIVAGGVYSLLLMLGPQLLNDPDTYLHVAIGRWILDHGAVPISDTFSFSVQGARYISFEWLSQVIYAVAYETLGWPGVVALTAAAIALAIGLLTQYLLRELPTKPTILMVVVAFALLAPHLLARPHVLALPIMVVWAGALVSSMDRRGRPPYWALPLLFLWANLHGSAVLALGLIGPANLEELLAVERTKWPQVFLVWLPFAASAFAVTCLTPYGIEPLIMPLTTLGIGDALKWINEWRPQDFSHIGVFEIVLLGGIFLLSQGGTLPVTRALVLLGLVHFALAQGRNADLLAVLAPLYLAAPVAKQIKASAENKIISLSRWSGTVILAAVVAATGLQLTRDIRPAASNTPEAAVARAGIATAGPVLNDYSFGGYLIYAGIPTFIDGRGEIFGGKFIDRYNRGIALADTSDFLTLLDDYKIRATLLTPSTPAVWLLDRLPGWERVYSDRIAVVHKRRSAPD
jgi:hypothetical protein